MSVFQVSERLARKLAVPISLMPSSETPLPGESAPLIEVAPATVKLPLNVLRSAAVVPPIGDRVRRRLLRRIDQLAPETDEDVTDKRSGVAPHQSLIAFFQEAEDGPSNEARARILLRLRSGSGSAKHAQSYFDRTATQKAAGRG